VFAAKKKKQMSSSSATATAPDVDEQQQQQIDADTVQDQQEERKLSRAYEMLLLAQLPRQFAAQNYGSLETPFLSSVSVQIQPGAPLVPAHLKNWSALRISLPVLGIPTDKRRPFAAQVSALTLLHYTCSGDGAHVALVFDNPFLKNGACSALPAEPITLEFPPGYYNAPMQIQLYRNDDFSHFSPDEMLRELRWSAYSTKHQLLSELAFDDSGKLVRACEKSALVAAWRQVNKDLSKVTKADAEDLAAKVEKECLIRRRLGRVYPHELTGEVYVQHDEHGNVPKCEVYMLFRVMVRELYAEARAGIVRM
jgi:hypothetical protein